ncbi:MAG: tRNA epoxyqueuosine(34) reductase QueG [Bacteroidetes bacterium]|nr:tRNA epoxyqueuosine(34) reductase QueG [Bacteroidota bacterium]
MLNRKELSEEIKKKASELGFHSCGISKAELLTKDAEHLKKWLAQNHHAEMAYMNNHFEKRIDPRELVENATSVISVLLNYYPEKIIPEEDNFKISKYAYGKDYHFVIKEMLGKLLTFIEQKTEKRIARMFVDSAPVLDRIWAHKSGLGWIGKNTCLITKDQGSFFFIGEIILDLDLFYDHEIIDYCGSCTKCLNACPTNALIAPYRLDSRKCISYLTIENKNNIRDQFKNTFQDWIFGCDICQDVCPWNSKSIPTTLLDFRPSNELLTMRKSDWKEIDNKKFNILFKLSAVKRTKLEGLKRNIRFVSE